MSWGGKHYITWPVIFLAFTELALFIVILLLLSRFYTVFSEAAFEFNHYDKSIITVLAALNFASMVAAGLYNRDAFHFGAGLTWNLATSVLLAAAAFAAFLIPYSIIQDVRFSSLYVVAIFAAGAQLVLLLLVRGLFVAIFNSVGFKRRLLVLGDGPLASKVDTWFSENKPRYAELIGGGPFWQPQDVPIRERHGGSVVALARHDELPSSGVLQRFVRDHAVDEIVVAAAEEVGETIWELLECRTNGIAVTDFLAFWERETGRIDLDAINASRLVYSEGFHCRPFRRNSKYALDFAVSAVGLAVTAPLIALAAIAIKLDSPGPVFYRQKRVGKNGEPFEIVKLRTMTVDAEKEGTPRWATVGDVRVTRIGALLRRTRIDELPQLINVLKGEMSLVGPRPERPAFVDAFERQIPLYAVRHCVRPGLTGWAQINYRYGASLDDAKRKLEYDLFYVKNHNVVLDIAIMLQTVRVVLWLQGGR